MRRGPFLIGVGGAFSAFGAPAVRAHSDVLAPWTPGTLDIHHISTGRGNAALIIFPDGTTALIDAGAVIRDPSAALAAARPNDSLRPGQWIGRYVRRALGWTGGTKLDVAAISHFHDDHIGGVAPVAPLHASGAFRLSGLTDVADIVAIETVIDRGAPPENDIGANYRGFLAWRRAQGLADARAQVGSAMQIRSTSVAQSTVDMRVLAADGLVWIAGGRRSAGATVPEDLDENARSIPWLLRFGRFRYYTGGDLHFSTAGGFDDAHDIESHTARVCGPVDVATVNHHGYHDAGGPTFVDLLRPSAYVVQAWHATHPAISTLERLLERSPRVGGRAPDVYLTASTAANLIVNDRFVDRLRDRGGHIVIRVAPEGARYDVLVVDDRDERGVILDRTTYASRAGQ